MHIATVTRNYYSWIQYVHVHRTTIKAGTFFSSLLLILGFITVKLLFPSVYFDIIQEDALLETLQAIVYSLSACCSLVASLCFYHGKHTHFAKLFFIMSVTLALITLEEMSWGQRLFHLETPTFFEKNNRQHEISIHNLAPIHDTIHYVYIALGTLLTLCTLLTSIPSVLQGKLPWCSPLIQCMPGVYTILYFLPLAMVYSALEYFRADVGTILVWRDQEPVEFLLSLGFLQITLVTLIRFGMSDSSEIPNDTGLERSHLR